MNDPFEPGFFARASRPFRRVAILRASRLGDLICATPALRGIRGAFPAAEISLIALPMFEQVIAGLRSVDRFVPFPGFPGIADQFFEAEKSLRFFEEMQAQRFDIVIQLHGSGVYSNPVALLLGGRQTVGFVREGDPPGRLDAAFSYPVNRHEVLRLLDFMNFLGIEANDRATEFPVRQESRDEAGRLLSGLPRPRVGLHPGAREKTKRWNKAGFAAVANRVADRLGGSAVVIGTEDDRRVLHEMVSGIRGMVCDLSGRTSLALLGGVIGSLDLLITNDSGPAHIAYALGTPSITLFGSTRPEEWAALDAKLHPAIFHPVDCRPCNYVNCPIGTVCLEKITVDEVSIAAERLLRRPGGSGTGGGPRITRI